jgi:hypothetical protein
MWNIPRQNRIQMSQADEGFTEPDPTFVVDCLRRIIKTKNAMMSAAAATPAIVR